MLRSFLFCFVFAILASTVACTCASGGGLDAGPDASGPGDGVDCRRGQLKCTIDGEEQCVAYDASTLCEPWEVCTAGTTTCDASGTPVCECEVAAALHHGTQVAFADSTQLANGALIVAGWNAGLAPHAYKDLNVGWWNQAGEHDVCSSGAIEWEIVRGIPEGEGPIADPDGYRGGVAATGASVGRYASIITLLDETGALSNDVLVAYEVVGEEGAFVELAHGRFNSEDEATVAFEWSFHAVEPPAGAIAIASTSLTLDQDGLPVLAYTVHHAPAPDAEPDPRQQPSYEIKLARAGVGVPAAAEDWTISTVAGPEDAGCTTDAQCGEDMRCIRAGFFGMCLNAADLSSCVGDGANDGVVLCDPGAGPPLSSPAEICVNKAEFAAQLPASNYLGDPAYDKTTFVDALCAETAAGGGHCCMGPMSLADYTPVNGLFLSLHAVGADQLALLSYGRRTGTITLHRIAANGTVSVNTFGDAGNDIGPGLSAVVDPNNNQLLHVAYVDALKSELHYARVNASNGTLVNNTAAMIDDGNPSAAIEGRVGPGFIGDNSDIVVVENEGALEVRIVYSDTANHHVVLARRAAGATGNAAFERSIVSTHVKEEHRPTEARPTGLLGDGNFPTIVANNDVENPGSSLITSTYRMTVQSRAGSDTCVYPYGVAEPADDGGDDDDDDNDDG